MTRLASEGPSSPLACIATLTARFHFWRAGLRLSSTERALDPPGGSCGRFSGFVIGFVSEQLSVLALREYGGVSTSCVVEAARSSPLSSLRARYPRYILYAHDQWESNIKVMRFPLSYLDRAGSGL